MKLFNFLKDNPFFSFLAAFALLSMSWFFSQKSETPVQPLQKIHKHSSKSSNAPTRAREISSVESQQIVKSENESSPTRLNQAETNLELSSALALFAQNVELHPGEIEDAEMLEKTLSNLQAVVREEATQN